MAFSPADRVRVTDQHSQWRNKFGTVMTVDGDGNHVRLDGQQPTQTELLLDAELTTSTLTIAITYS